MERIENEKQYNEVLERIEVLLRVVNDDTPQKDPNSIELMKLSMMVEEYEDAYVVQLVCPGVRQLRVGNRVSTGQV